MFTRRVKRNQKFRRGHSSEVLGGERLEARWMLSGTPPAVTDVNLSSTDWDSSFVDYLEQSSLGTDGYSIPVGSASQLTTLPWTNLNQIHITFSEDVTIDSYDLSITGVNQTSYEFSDFTYDDQNFVATWTFSNYLENDKLLIDLDADGLDPVQDVDENALDGEWTDGSSTYDSGDSTAGGDFEFRVNILPGDANTGGLVTTYDYVWIRARDGLDTSDPGYDHFRDLDGSGNIDSVDYLVPLGIGYDAPPTGDPAGTSSDAPTSAGFTAVEVDENSADEVLSLFDAFDDAEDTDSELTYEVLSNGNPNLFDSVSVDEVMGDLTLDFAADEFGEAELVIRATDTDGIFIDVPLSVDVESTNVAPVISDFDWYVGVTGLIVFHGTVTDVDNDPTGWTVEFGGLLAGETATVISDGTFEKIVELDPETWGTVTAQTEDDEGLLSNLAEVEFEIS